MESFPIAWRRIEPTVSDQSAPVAHNQTVDFPDAVCRDVLTAVTAIERMQFSRRTVTKRRDLPAKRSRKRSTPILPNPSSYNPFFVCPYPILGVPPSHNVATAWGILLRRRIRGPSRESHIIDRPPRRLIGCGDPHQWFNR